MLDRNTSDWFFGFFIQRFQQGWTNFWIHWTQREYDSNQSWDSIIHYFSLPNRLNLCLMRLYASKLSMIIGIRTCYKKPILWIFQSSKTMRLFIFVMTRVVPPKILRIFLILKRKNFRKCVYRENNLLHDFCLWKSVFRWTLYGQ